jgi:peptidoglycan-associated lipoprotein
MFRRLYATALLVATGLLTACTTQPPAPEQRPTEVSDARAAAQPGDGSLGQGVQTDSEAARSLTAPGNILSQRAVYFGYDSYTIDTPYRALVEAHAKFVGNNAQDKVLIQGSADDRGSREYNLALGQKRADAVKRAMQLLGAREDQIEAVSLGKEKPVCTDAAESCYAKNRRADIKHSLAREF